MAYRKVECADHTLVLNKNGRTLGMADAKKIIEVDGLAFKNLAGADMLLPYEDWRLDAKTRAKDLASRLSIGEIAGLMLYSSHQMVPFPAFGPFSGHYGGRTFDESGAEPWALTDEQQAFVTKDHIRHILQMRVQDAETSARWSNNLQALAEKQRWGIPVNISTDPRHGASASGAEFKSAGQDVSKWPEGIGMVATGSPELVKQFAAIAAKEYRALGITTALGPQIDLSTEPRWMRMEDTFGSQVEMSIAMTKAYCDGLQTTEGEADGWGRNSVIAMVKHWPGGGTGEGGRDAHYPFGEYAVYPGGNFAEHLRPFTEGAFKLDGPTGKAGAVMPYYTVSWQRDTKNGMNVGNSYSEYIIKDMLREEYEYDGVVCTDWGITGAPASTIDSFGSRCYGQETLSEAEQHLRIIMNGVDQFGGNNRSEPVMEAYKLGCERYGAKFMRERMEVSAVHLLTNIFRLGLFENPYLDPEESKRIVGCAENVKAGLLAQYRSLTLLKNSNAALPLRRGIKVYVPERTIKARKNFFRGMDAEKTVVPFEGTDVSPYFTLVNDPAQADAAIVMMESPLTDGYSSGDLAQGGNGYLPLSLQYRPYTAANARPTSIAGGDFRENSANRSYRGKTNSAANESDLDNVLNARAAMPDKPVIVCLRMHNPTVPAEFEKYADALVADFGVQNTALLAVLFGDATPGGRLPYAMPHDMEAVEAHCEDMPDDIAPYTDCAGNTYARGFGLHVN